MIFNQEEVIALCEKLGIKMEKGNIPKMNGKYITEDDSKGFFYKKDEDCQQDNKYNIDSQIYFHMKFEDIFLEEDDEYIDNPCVKFKINKEFLEETNMKNNIAVDNMSLAA